MRWKAVTQQKDGSFVGIVTVRAYTLSQAKERVREQLSRNPSRRAYLERWEAGGSIVMRHELYLKQ